MGLFRSMVCLSGIVLVSMQTVTRPPKIYVEPCEKTIFFNRGEPLELKCIADGIPTPTYKWQKNSFDWIPAGNDERVVQLPNQGTIVFNLTDDRTEGVYQCFAYNGYGVSPSKKFHLRESRIDYFPVTDTQIQQVDAGTALTLPCVPQASIPLADVYWVVKGTYGAFAPVVLDERVSMDLEGSLRFTNVKKSDEQGGKAYVCVFINNFARKMVTGPQYKVTVIGTTELKSQPSELWTSPIDQLLLRGSILHLQCIFAGNPTPVVHWKKQGDASFHKSGQKLTIPDAQYSDAGQYECFGTQNNNNSQTIRKSFEVRIEAIPYWIEVPKVVDTYSGENATFTCRAGGVPAPLYLWYINGVAWDKMTDNETLLQSDPSFPQRLEVNNDTLTMVNLHPTDQMNIQCNATNQYGYVFADVFLNVFSAC